jgi:hypothetical protein
MVGAQKHNVPSGDPRVRVFVDSHCDWRVEGLGPEVTSQRFGSREEAQRLALERLGAVPDAGDIVVRDAYHRVVAIIAAGSRTHS